MADNLTDGLNELAQGFQKRFSVSSKLSIDDMIKLVTPPAFYNGEVLAQNITLLAHPKWSSETKIASFDLKPVPPEMEVPIKLNFNIVCTGGFWYREMTKVVFVGDQKTFYFNDRYTTQDSDPSGGNTVKSITIPAHTTFMSGRIDVYAKSFYALGIESVTATY